MADEFSPANVTTDLARLRGVAGLTQAEFATATGMSRSYVALVETNRRPMPPDKVDLACDVLRTAHERREADRARMRETLDRIMPFTEEDAARLEALKAAREAKWTK